ncbi:ExeA family protein, partial [Rubrivivax gelatinosus]|uniref:ExeA family protein n=1 Tax=Rubrivivax gelatinosus TaxID=28068 RepID=UPI001907D4C5
MNVESFFGLAREPFSIAPDPRFLFPSEQHREALELLNYGLARGASFVLLTGEIGAGKTTVWRTFLEQLPSNVDVASVVNPRLGVDALIARVFEDLRVELPPADGPVDMIDALHGHLLLAHAQGRRTLIVIDEAQALSHEVLEQLRLLTNLDSSGRKLQVLLIGQPELREMLTRPDLEPLAQRIVVRFHLGALSETQTAAYIEHRLAVAGYEGTMPFDGESLGLVQRFSGGVPRRINVLCDRALAVAAQTGTRRIGREILERAAHDVAGPPVLPASRAASSPAAAPAPAPAGGTATMWAFGAGQRRGHAGAESPHRR